jgi:hypothetical protein
LTSNAGSISGCNGVIAVMANSLTLNAAASVGGALLENGNLFVIAPMAVNVNQLHGSVGGLGIFLTNPRVLEVDDAVATGSAPAGLKHISIVPTSPIDPEPEGEQSPWQNQRNSFDVNDDSFVSPLDALATINFLTGSTSIGSGEASFSVTMLYLDVNGDRRISAIDALQIINYLNAADAIFAEGESTATNPDDLESTVFPSSIDLRPRHTDSLTPATSAVSHPAQRSTLNTMTPGARATLAAIVSTRTTDRVHASNLPRFSDTDLESALDELSLDVAEQWQDYYSG